MPLNYMIDLNQYPESDNSIYTVEFNTFLGIITVTFLNTSSNE